MAKFKLTQTLKFNTLGKEWADCYMRISEPSIGDIQSIMSLDEGSSEAIGGIISVIENCFIEGRGYDGEKVVTIKSKDISELPISVIKVITNFLLNLAQNANETSNDMKQS